MTSSDPGANLKSSYGCFTQAAENNPAVLSEAKPVLDVTLVAGRPRIDWEKQGMDAIEIHVKRDADSSFALLAVDTIPDYDDTAALPAPGQSAVWKYKAIYRLGDERVGQWSDEVSIVVMG